jgi:nucleoside-triphosphatase THEP1
MARIQILELPTVVVGEDVKTPFVVVIDEIGPAQVTDQRVRQDITEQTGAEGTIFSAVRLDVVGIGDVLEAEASPSDVVDAARQLTGE